VAIYEDKVKAASFGAGASGTVTAFVLWALDSAFWHGDALPDVPLPVVGLVAMLIPAAGAFLGGYVTRHTPRPDLEPVVPVDSELEAS
jgi:hypothetical protein